MDPIVVYFLDTLLFYLYIGLQGVNKLPFPPLTLNF